MSIISHCVCLASRKLVVVMSGMLLSVRKKTKKFLEGRGTSRIAPGDLAVVGVNLFGVTSCPLTPKRRTRVDEVC